MNPPPKKSHLISFFVFFVLSFIAYSNTFHASWHLDDIPNIVNNDKLHVVELTPHTLAATFKAHPVLERKDSFYRPLSMLSFGLNWYLGRDNVFGYHLFNILLHILTGCLLYVTILTLFKTEQLKKQNNPNVHFVAFLATLLWLISPIQTQAVTYIVQRMALLGTFFYLLSLYLFLKTRLESSKLRKTFYIVGCFLAFFAALASKENTITLPIACLLIEIIFFQKLTKPVSKKSIFLAVTLVSIIVVECVYLYFKIQDLPLFKLYDHRSFSLMERLVSEHRIIILYLTQIFLPSPQRLSLIHDFSVSTSLLHPWTTLPSVILVYLLIITGFLCIPRRPIIAFSILFFFLAHTVESTFLPLELIFEHRNYLPTLFIFLPFAIALQQLLIKFHNKRWMHQTIIVSICLLIIIFTFTTYIKNATWKNEETLWLTILKKAPNSARPYQNLGKLMIHSGHYDKALELYKISLTKQDPSPKRSASVSLNNMGNIYLSMKQYDSALKHYNNALVANPDSIEILYNATGVLLTLGKWSEASRNADKLLYIIPYEQNALIIKGFILLKQGELANALNYFQDAYTINPHNVRTTIHFATAKSLLGQHKEAETLLLSALEESPARASILFSLLENSNRAGDTRQVQHFTKKILNTFSFEQIDKFLPSTQEEMNSSILDGPTLHNLLIPAE